ncbi:MAG: type III-B CRISPR-associated protein Cas10/Cmr2 [Candidatus Sumerlaeaceae bacterium]|nr:type III-B CRISPR-associated protein Cas10/Cmr2 [Candidatus Sumerlaeaceae bacterium]
MTSHLVALSIGPVQDFIAAARRTRDLWFGSHVLSEISKAAARALHKAAGVDESLIFPAVGKQDIRLLDPQDTPGAFNVGNVVLALLPDRVVPEDAIKEARDAAQERWQQYADKVKKELGDLIDPARWDAQVKDVVEFYAACVPLEDDSGYKQARDRVMRLLAGRKACRDFAQPDPAADAHGVPKSALDGARASVWSDKVKAKSDTESPTFPQRLRHRIRAAGAEQLDAVGLVKRLGGEDAAFPSIPRIAADPWLRGADETCSSDFKEFLTACQKVPNLPKLDTTKFPQFEPFKTFPCDGALVFEGRLREIEKEISDQGNGKEAINKVKECLRRLVRDRGLGEPEPYLAVLAADGDKMGAALSKLESPQAHRNFSRALSAFADTAREIVQNHYGCTIYAGGDDVLALVPVDQVLECAWELHDTFGAALNKQAPADTKPTLSVGIALGHSMDPMEDLLHWARDAEKAAKGGPNERDGLAIHLHTRGGAPVRIRGKWTDQFDRRLRQWADCFRDGTIPDKAAYDLQLLARDYLQGDGKPLPGLGDNADLLTKDVLRLFKRKKEQGAGANLNQVEELVKAECQNARDLLDLANELVVARRIARAKQQADPRGLVTVAVGAGEEAGQ